MHPVAEKVKAIKDASTLSNIRTDRLQLVCVVKCFGNCKGRSSPRRIRENADRLHCAQCKDGSVSRQAGKSHDN